MNKRCSYCGDVNDGNASDQCTVCAEPFLRQTAIIEKPSSSSQTVPADGFTFEDSGSPPRNPPPSNSAGIGREIQEQPESNTITARLLRPLPLVGVITELERTEEQPQTNYYKIMSIMLLILLCSPLFITIFIISIALVIAFSIIRLQPLAHMFNPLTWTVALIELMEIFVIGRLRRSDQQAIYRGVIRDDGHNLYNFYLWGLLRTGNLIKGHRVSFTGVWRIGNRRNQDERGTLEVESGMDLSTRSSITSNWGNPWRNIFYILLLLSLGLIGWGWMNSGKITNMANNLL